MPSSTYSEVSKEEASATNAKQQRPNSLVDIDGRLATYELLKMLAKIENDTFDELFISRMQENFSFADVRGKILSFTSDQCT
jgi:hypothetical protein